MRTNLLKANKIVIKVGTSSLTYNNGKLNLRQIEKLCNVITDLSNSGKEVILISSGAIGAGVGRLSLKSSPSTLQMKQATAAIGQAYLMQIYQRYFDSNNQLSAQMLLTKDIVNNDIKRTNVIRTFKQLLELNVVPIVNENDTISTDEIVGNDFSDNDNLSAIVSGLVKADLLIILTDVDGVYKKINGKHSKSIIENVDKITNEIYGYVTNDSTTLGTGGMSSKLNAVKYAMEHKVDSVICNSKDLDIIYKIIEGQNVGSFFKGA